MSSQTRRTHTKSRRGCHECKRRKIKCDEEQPMCSGCVKRCVPCNYPNASSLLQENDISPPLIGPTTGSSLESVGNSPAGMSPGEGGRLAVTPSSFSSKYSNPTNSAKVLGLFDKQDMALWHQFVTETAVTIFNESEAGLIRLAFSCDFLMHGILSSAALHLAYLHPDQRTKYHYMSVQHQDLAMGPFQQATTNISMENCNETFAFAALLVISQFASFRYSGSLLPSAEVASSRGPANWMVSLRGLMFIYDQAKTHISTGPLRALISAGIKVGIETARRTEIPKSEDDQSLEHLAQNLLNLASVKSSTTVAEMEAYVESITWLRKLLAASVELSGAINHRILSSMWPIMLSELFIRMLSEERPVALIIVAHYCLLLKRCEATWFIEHRAYDLLQAVQRSLHEEWMPYVEYPLHIVDQS